MSPRTVVSVVWVLLPLSFAAGGEASGAGASSSTGFAGIFGDHMVLQRDAPVRVWGRAPPGQHVTIELAGASRETAADGGGEWQVELPAMSAGGPHRLTLRADGKVADEVGDVLLGDLWLCSGQSNMEFPVARASGGAEAAALQAPEIRLVTIPKESAAASRAAFGRALHWRVAREESVRDFSAVCWFFAEALRERQRVPLGLLHASWGGSRIEAWLGANALRDVGGFDAGLELLRAYAADPHSGSARFAETWERWWRGSSGAGPAPWLDEATGWRPVPQPLRDWKAWDDAALAAHDGMVWFRNSFELDPAQADAAAVLALGGIDEVDLTWVNGRFVGTRFGWGTERRYPVPARFLRAGHNTVTVNVLSTWGSGGLLGPGGRVALELDGGGRVRLADGWTYRKVPAETGLPPRAPWEPISGLTGLSNAMIAPLGALPMTGALWYQGESNAGDAGTYERLLAALIKDWRSRFGESLGFVIVQLPNFGATTTEPVESGWARIRDAQRRVAESDPRAGLVVTLDAGDDRDLHPPNKSIVGRRAAEVARALVAGAPAIVDGIGPARAYRQADRIVIELAPANERLVVVGDDRPVAFELCGEAGCAYADAVLDHNRIVLSSPAAAGAQRVRHCWADAPICNLYGASGLPVASFETRIREP